MSQKSLYILSVRAIVIVLIAVFIVGAVGGSITSWFVTKQLLKKQGTGSRIIERVQNITGIANTLPSVVQNMRQGVIGILDEKGNVIQTGVVLTADGIAITPQNKNLPTSLRVLFSDGTTKPAATVRTYTEKKVVFLKVAGSFPAPNIASDSSLTPGTVGVFVKTIPGLAKVGAVEGAIEYFSQGGLNQKDMLLEKHVKLSTLPGEAYLGAPFLGDNQELLGILIDSEKGIVLPASELNVLLQDYLKHPTGSNLVTVLDGAEVEWSTIELVPGKVSTVFVVKNVYSNSTFAQAGLKTNDVIVAVNEKPFPAANLWQTFLESARSVKPVTLTVQRGNQEIKLVTSSLFKDASKK